MAPTFPQGEPQVLGPRHMLQRSEFIRLLEQALQNLGYTGLAARLEAESGIMVQPPSATAFRDAVLEGRWDDAVGSLSSLAASGPDAARARFLLRRQEFCEAVSAGDTAHALLVLRERLTPLGVDEQLLRGLASRLIAGGGSAGEAVPGAEGGNSALAGGTLRARRETLLAELQHLLPPSLLIPERRLEELVEQALLAQAGKSHYVNAPLGHQSLFVDFLPGPEQLPTVCTQTLDLHNDEVWALAFSLDGSHMASASKDGCAVLWRVGARGDVTYACHLARSAVPVNSVAFSPDGRWVLTSGADGRVRLCGLPSGALVHEANFMGAAGGDCAVASTAWFPDSRRFCAAVYDCAVYVLDVRGMTLCRLKYGQHIYDCTVSADGGTLISVGQDRAIRFHRLADDREEVIPAEGPVTCFSASADASLLALTLSSGAIHLWPIGDYRASTGGADASAPPASTDNDGEAMDADSNDVDRPQAATDAAHGSARQVRAVPSFPPPRPRPVAEPNAEAPVVPGPGTSPGPGAADEQRSPRRPAAQDPMDALPREPVQKYQLPSAGPGRFIIRSTIGGYANNFVASGCESGAIHIWHRTSGALLKVLQGHEGTVNAVAWSPADRYLIASASDDHTIRIWRAKAAMEGSWGPCQD